MKPTKPTTNNIEDKKKRKIKRLYKGRMRNEAKWNQWLEFINNIKFL